MDDSKEEKDKMSAPGEAAVPEYSTRIALFLKELFEEKSCRSIFSIGSGKRVLFCLYSCSVISVIVIAAIEKWPKSNGYAPKKPNCGTRRPLYRRS